MSFAFSRDGELTAESRTLFEGCDLLVHEAFMPDENVAGHGNAHDVIAYAAEHGIADLRLVHLDWQIRRTAGFDAIVAAGTADGVNVRIAEDGDVIEL